MEISFIIFYYFSSLEMKLISPNQLLVQNDGKPSGIIFHINRSCDKFPLPLVSNLNVRNTSLLYMINSLHSFANEGKPIPNQCIKKIIQILSHLQIKNHSLQNYANLSQKTPEKMSLFLKRQLTDNIHDNNVRLKRACDHKQGNRMRKMKSRKKLENMASEFKQKQKLSLVQSRQKKIVGLQSNLEQLKKLFQDQEKELKAKQLIISKTQRQKQFFENSCAELLKNQRQDEKRWKEEKEKMFQDLREAQQRLDVLKGWLVQRQAQILSFWKCSLGQRAQ